MLIICPTACCQPLTILGNLVFPAAKSYQFFHEQDFCSYESGVSIGESEGKEIAAVARVMLMGSLTGVAATGVISQWSNMSMSVMWGRHIWKAQAAAGRVHGAEAGVASLSLCFLRLVC